MQVTKAALHKALDALSRIIPARSSNPILSYVRLRREGEKLELYGTNTEIELLLEIPCQWAFGEDWNLVVPGHLMAQMVKNFSSTIITIQQDPMKIRLSGAGAEVELQLGDRSFYPEISPVGEKQVSFNIEQLVQAIDVVNYATASESFQQALRGVCLEIVGETARAVATDGFRLAYQDLPVLGSGQMKIIIPNKAVSEVVHVLEGAPGEVHLNLQKGALQLQWESGVMTLKLLDGEFPAYQTVVPTSAPIVLELDGKNFAAEVNRVQVMTAQNANYRIVLTVMDEVMTLSAEGDYGTAEGKLQVKQLGTVPHFVLYMNGKYLQQTLAKLNTGQIRMHALGGARPCKLEPMHDQQQPEQVHVIVPLRS